MAACEAGGRQWVTVPGGRHCTLDSWPDSRQRLVSCSTFLPLLATTATRTRPKCDGVFCKNLTQASMLLNLKLLEHTINILHKTEAMPKPILHCLVFKIL